MRPSRPFLIALAVLAVVAVLLWLSLRRKTTAEDRLIATEIEYILDGPRPHTRATEVAMRPLWEQVQRFYRDRHHLPAWCEGTRLRPEAVQLLGVLQGMSAEGIDPGRYEADSLSEVATRLRKNRFRSDTRYERLARWDVRMTRAFLLVARDLRDGRVPRDLLDENGWGEKKRQDLAHILAEAVKDHEPRKELAALVPRDAAYARLRDALASYRAIAEHGGWPTLGRGPDLKRGAEGMRVALLRRRLASTGDLASAGGNDFDRDVEKAVRGFQLRHGLDVTGRVDAMTREALDVSVEKRIHTMELNLERRRWLPDSLAEPRVEVNIPAFALAVRDSGRTVMAMNVVVGRVASQTPVFSDAITYLELNPVWRLPQGIVTKEIVPLFEHDREYLMKQNMVVTYREGGDTTALDPASIDWTAAAEDSISPYLVTQRAGPLNPLGQIKLMCPNDYDVYLHDTPARHLFQNRYRALSHGCVRLEHPVELGQRVLGEQPERDSLQALVDRGEWKRIGIKHKVPVHFLYWTAWVDEDGVVQFRRDVYSLDQRLDQALHGEGLAEFRVNLPAEEFQGAP